MDANFDEHLLRQILEMHEFLISLLMGLKKAIFSPLIISSGRQKPNND